MKTLSFEDVKTFLAPLVIEEDGVDGTFLTEDIRAFVQTYRQNHTYRLWHSLDLLLKHSPANRPLRILELGSTPYFFSALLLFHFNYEVIGSNVQAKIWPGTSKIIEKTIVKLRHPPTEQIKSFPVYIFNFELDEFPFDDSEFDVVLCMEVIEHLIYSPTHMLAEAHRVLKPGGTLLLSTPNSINLHKTFQLIRNRSIDFHYSAYGIYGRHNREFTKQELTTLLQDCDYVVNHLQLENVYFRFAAWPPNVLLYKLLLSLSYLPLPYLANKRDYIFLIATSTGTGNVTYSETLYQFPKIHHGATASKHPETGKSLGLNIAPR